MREAFATAQPYSASLLGFGDTFVYNQGVLCYLDADLIRVLDVHDWARIERVINARAVLNHPTFGLRASHDHAIQFSLLHYSDGILACLCEIEERGESYLIAFNVRLVLPPNHHRVRLIHQLRNTTRLFVRHTERFLYYGTHSGIGPHGHHEWLIQGLEFCNGLFGRPVSEKPIQLEMLVGSELGLTVCFQIHEDYFYALSNQTSYEVEEVDWTSFYHCYRLPLDNPTKLEPENGRPHRFWRRQHIEGPINDSWTDLSIHVDECTNKLLIAECRREWRHGGSASLRTYYTEPLVFPEKRESSAADEADGHQPSSSATPPQPPYTTMLPLNDPLTTTLDESSKPNYEPAKIRLPRQEHPEYTAECSHKSPPREFILAKTKYRTYNPSSLAFLDLVNDPEQQYSFSGGDRLRLRIGSRQQSSPLYVTPEGKQSLWKPPLNDKNNPVEGSDERFIPRGINLWPPDDGPDELQSLLCPFGKAGEVEAISDERSIIYMTGPGQCPYSSTEHKRAIVLINFDPTVSFPNLKRLSLNHTGGDPRAIEVQIERTKAGDDVKGKRRAVTLTIDAEQPAQKQARLPSYRTEPARYLAIDRGYRLR